MHADGTPPLDPGLVGADEPQRFHFRDQQGLEVDFVVPGKHGGVVLIEAKATRTVKPSMAEPLSRLGVAWSRRSGQGRLQKLVVHRERRTAINSRALAPGVQAVPISKLVANA